MGYLTRLTLDGTKANKREHPVCNDNDENRDDIPLQRDELWRTRKNELTDGIQAERQRDQRPDAADDRTEAADRKVETAEEVDRLLQSIRQLPGLALVEEE